MSRRNFSRPSALIAAFTFSATIEIATVAKASTIDSKPKSPMNGKSSIFTV